jgi:hypothetical protein
MKLAIIILLSIAIAVRKVLHICLVLILRVSKVWHKLCRIEQLLWSTLFVFKPIEFILYILFKALYVLSTLAAKAYCKSFILYHVEC